jgi:hypothetical protein
MRASAFSSVPEPGPGGEGSFAQGWGLSGAVAPGRNAGRLIRMSGSDAVAKSQDRFTMGFHRSGAVGALVMMYVVRLGGDVDEIPHAVSTAVQGEHFLCLDRRGSEVKRYTRQSVVMFGHNERLKRYDPRSRWRPRRGHR